MRISKEDRRSVNPKREWDSLEYLGLNPDSHDWARLASFIDGEGTIGLSPRRTNSGKSLTLCAKAVVTNTDFRLAKWCYETFSMKYYTQRQLWAGERAVNWASCYYAQACGYKAVWILRNCLPWFLLKKEQAEVVIAHQKTIGPEVWQRGPGLKTPQDILDYRMQLKERLANLNKRGPRESEQILMEA